MTTISIDIETRSSVDITKCGTVKYVESPDFTILLISYSYGDSQGNYTVRTVDLTVDALEQYFVNDLTDPTVIKTAFNAFFERTCLGKYLGIYMPPEQWRCTQVKASTLGLPVNLGLCAKALQLETLKESEGKALIKFFSCPHAITKKDMQEKFSVLELKKLFSIQWRSLVWEFEIQEGTTVADKYLDGFKSDCIRHIKDNDVMVFYEPHHDPEKWERYKHYNNTDVKVELGILAAIKWHNIVADEQQLWNIDQQINELGVGIDMTLVDNALAIDAIYREQLLAEALELTGLNNPNSATQVKRWLTAEMPDEAIDTLRKDDVSALLKLTDGHPNKTNIDRVLGIRQELSKTSIKKYVAMQNYVCNDGRAHGLLQFYGANRTGRWAGRGIQFQNLRRISLKSGMLDFARTIVKEAKLDWYVCSGKSTKPTPPTRKDALHELLILWDNPSDILSQLIRTAFIPRPGYKFLVADFSAIEARVISWLAKEEWRLEVFRTHGMIYEASASKMFRIAMELITKDSPYRQKGKISELALGYQGAVNALLTMGALNDPNIRREVDTVMQQKGITEVAACVIVLMPLVTAWRQQNPKIVSMWYRVQEAAIDAVKTRETTMTHGLTFYMKENVLFIKLHSGRSLAYWNAEVRENSHGEYLSYEGLNQKSGLWCRIDTYGGKLVENIVQGEARDCLAYTIVQVKKRKGIIPAMHVHDEGVWEVPEDSDITLDEICKIMSEEIPWAKGLPLGADGFEGKYYKK